MFIRVHPWFQALLGSFADAWRGLAARAKMAASAGHDYAADDRLATKARFPIALVDPVTELELAAIAVGIDII